jgi:arylsulfatase A-like enzyme
LEFQPNGQLPLPPGTTTVAGILGQASYATGIIGKWGLGGPDTSGIPNRQGFDFFYGYLDQIRAHNYFPPFLWRNQEKEPLNNEAVYADRGYAKGVGSASTRREEYSHDLFTKEALAFLTRNREKPFFLYLAYTIPHANNEAWVLRRNAMEVPDYGIYSSKPWPEEEKGYAAMISRMDQDVGKLLAKLNELGLTERTLVMFSSDNGPHDENGQDPSFFQSAGPLRGRKTDLYEGGIRVPLIIYWPGKVKPGSVSDHISAFWDFLPTCSELAGVPIPKGIDGISMVPTLLGKPKTQQKHDFLYWEFHEGGSKQAVRMKDWKAIRLIPGRPLQLYNLKSDHGERRDVSARHPRVIAKIEDYLRAARSDSQYWTLSMEGQAPAP